ALEVGSAHGINFHFEDLLHGLLDFRLGGFAGHFENQGAFVFLHAQAFFGNYRAANNLVCRFHYATSALSTLRRGALAFSESCNRSSAGRVKIAVSYLSKW